MSEGVKAVEQESNGGVVSLPAFLALLVGSIILLYGVQGNSEVVTQHGTSAIRWMVWRWSGLGGDLSHGWMIPLVSAYVFWRRRSDLAAAVKRPDARGALIVAAVLLLHIVGVRTQQTRLSLMSMVTLIWALPFTFYGWAFARLLIFPCAYLFFCIPFSFLSSITVPLRILASTASTVLLNGLGIRAVQSGTAIYSSAGGVFNFDVADACSGLRSLLALTAIAAAYANFTQRGLWRQWLLFLSAVPLALVGNVVRIVTIALVAQAFGAQRAMDFYHDYSDFIIFPVAVSAMMGLGVMLSRVKPEKESTCTG